MPRKFDLRVVAGAILGLVIGYIAEEVIGFVPPEMKIAYRATLAVVAAACILFLSGVLEDVAEGWSKWRRRRMPLLIGVISGYESRKQSGRRCGSAYSSKLPEDWQRFFVGRVDGGKPLFNVKLVHPSRITSRFSAIVNPFGEVFPESDLDYRTDLSRVVEYVKQGGVFVNCGGYPFFYNWNYELGVKVDTTPRTSSISVTPGGLVVTSTELFLDSLATKNFGVFIRDGTTGPQQRAFYQTPEDQARFGDLTTVGGSPLIAEFRALERETPNLLPGLRAVRDKREVFPLAGIQVGKGYLIVAGMNVKSDAEFHRIAFGMENFLRFLGGLER